MPLIRKARMQDVKPIHQLLVERGEGDGMVLPRSLSQLYGLLRDFCVAVDDEGRVLGACALHITWDDLAEVRSLRVAADARGEGLGRKLVETCLSEAVTLGISRVFVLTDQTGFFEHMGFDLTEKDSLPQKVWADCLNCHRFPDCDEVAMLMEL